MTDAPKPERYRRLPDKALRLALGKFLQHRLVIMALAVRGSGVLAAFVVTYLLGKFLGAEALGQYALMTQTAMFLAVVGLFGLDISVVRHFTRAVSKGAKMATASVLKVLGVAAAAIAGLALVLWASGDTGWKWLFGDVVPATYIVLLCILLAGRGGVQLLGGLLRSQNRFFIGQVVTNLCIPLGTAIALALGIVGTLDGALWAAATAGILATGIGVVALLPHASSREDAIDIRLRLVMASSLPLWGAGLAQVIGNWYGLAVSAQILGAAETGLFRISVQVASLLQVVTSALMSVYSPKLSAAFHSHDRAQAALLARSAVRISAALAFPITAIVLIASEFVLGQIGPEFVKAAPVLTIMMVGQFAMTLTGPSGVVLAMSGNEKLNLLLTLSATIAVLFLAPLGAYLGGLTGLAAAIASALFARNLAAMLLVRGRLGIRVWSGTASERL